MNASWVNTICFRVKKAKHSNKEFSLDSLFCVSTGIVWIILVVVTTLIHRARLGRLNPLFECYEEIYI